MPTVELTSSERCLLHLLEFRGMDDAFEYPDGVTQKGIAQAIGSQRKHMPRVLNKLEEKGLLTERQARIEGAKQRMKVYLLTMDGIAKAKEIERFVEDKAIKVRNEKGKLLDSKICDVNSIVKGDFTLIEIISNLTEDDIFEGIIEIMDAGEPKKMPPRQEIYWHTMLQVWKDGKSSVDEEEILEELRGLLDISEEEHVSMQEKIIRYASPVRKRLLEIYSAAYRQALKDKHVTEDEKAILEVLREKLGIMDEEMKTIEKGMK
jgi:DNA-binding MarR family transcriptional regulator